MKTGVVKPGTIILTGLLSAVLLAVQVALAGLPNIELVSLLVILYTLHFGRRTLFIIYTFVLLQGLLYGFGMWWFSYLYVWTVLYVLVRLCSRNGSRLFWAFLSGAFGLGFGALCSLPYLFVAGPGGALAYFIAGIPFDIAHCIGNAVAAAVLFRPLDRALGKASQHIEGSG